jgi:hypothetical protein
LSTVNYAGLIIKKNFNLQKRPSKIKVLVLRQRRPLKISADGTFLLPYRTQITAARIFEEEKKSNLLSNLSFQACR